MQPLEEHQRGRENPAFFKRCKHYHNILMFSPDWQALNTISERRAKWYLARNIAEAVPDNKLKELGWKHPGGIVLKFEPKKRPSKIAEFRISIKENICVMCGKNQFLSLHHIVPRFIRQYFPYTEKARQHAWCVLMCRTCHNKADAVARSIYSESFDAWMKKIHFEKAGKTTQEKARKTLINLLASNRLQDIPCERIEKLSQEAGVDNLSSLRVEPSTPIDPSEHRKTWVYNFIESMGGVDNVKKAFREAFLSLHPKFLLEGVARNYE
jgi:hypothetical protein